MLQSLIGVAISMKILIYASFFKPYISGYAKMAEKISDMLSQKNKVLVLTFPHKKNLKEEEVLAPSLMIKRMPYLFKISKGYISPGSISCFFQNARQSDTIVVFAPNFEALLLALFAKVFRKKLVVFYICEVFLGSGFFSRTITTCLNASVFFQLLAADRIIAFPDYANSVSVLRVFMRKTMLSYPPVAKLKTDQAQIKRFETDKQKKYWIGFVGRIAAEKGIEHLVDAGRLLIEENISLELVFAGPLGDKIVGENQYFKKIKNRLRMLNIPHRFLGVLSGGKLGAFYRTIDMLVLPSVNRTEAFGMVQVEAMLAETPVVASDLPGVRIPVLKSGMGLVVKPGNSRELADAIFSVIKNRNRFANKQNVNKIERIFDVKETYKKLEQYIINA